MSFQNKPVFLFYFYRHDLHINILLFQISDMVEQLMKMYQKENLVISPSTNTKIEAHLDFLRMMSDCSKQSLCKRGLTQHDFKVLSALYLYLVDTFKVFDIKDYTKFFETFSTGTKSFRL